MCESNLGPGEADSHDRCEAEFMRRQNAGKCVHCGKEAVVGGLNCGPCEIAYVNGESLAYRGYPPRGAT